MIHSLASLLATNAVAAAGFAVVVALGQRFVPWAAARHLLWVAVLVRLVAPPIWSVPVADWIPDALLVSERTALAGSPPLRDGAAENPPSSTMRPILGEPLAVQAARPQETALAGEPRSAASSVITAARVASLNAKRLLVPILALEGVGALTLLGLAVFRQRRMRAALDNARPAPALLQARYRRVADRLGVRSAPPLRLVTDDTPPMLLSPPNCVLLLPAALVDRLHPDELDVLLAHELAHVRRRDPRVRLLELAATALYWWHPVLWWARSRVRWAEEAACDALVLREFPSSARPYAEGLLKTVEFLSLPPRLPALATGAAGDPNHLQERIVMIFQNTRPRAVPARLRIPGLLLLLGFLAFSPTWTRPSSAEAESAPPDVAIERETQAAFLALQGERLELEGQMYDLRLRERQLEMRMAEVHVQGEVKRLELAAQQAEIHGRREEFDALRAELAALKRRAEREIRQQTKERELMTRELELDQERSRLQLEQEGAYLAEDTVRMAEIEFEAQKLEQKAQELHLEQMRQRVEQQEEMLKEVQRELEEAAQSE